MAPQMMTKKAIDELLVSERKTMRSKQKQSKFMSKTLSIYNGQKKRFAALIGEPKAGLSYTLEEFRDFFSEGLEMPCAYTGQKLTLTNVAVDHRTPIARGGAFTISNLVLCTQSANWEKGIMTQEEFTALMQFVDASIDPKAAKDLKMRLTLGGKWAAKKF